MERRTNALAELAKRMKSHLEVANAVAGFDQQVWRDFRAAQSIVAEQANREAHHLTLRQGERQ